MLLFQNYRGSITYESPCISNIKLHVHVDQTSAFHHVGLLNPMLQWFIVGMVISMPAKYFRYGTKKRLIFHNISLNCGEVLSLMALSIFQKIFLKKSYEKHYWSHFWVHFFMNTLLLAFAFNHTLVQKWFVHIRKRKNWKGFSRKEFLTWNVL